MSNLSNSYSTSTSNLSYSSKSHQPKFNESMLNLYSNYGTPVVVFVLATNPFPGIDRVHLEPSRNGTTCNINRKTSNCSSRPQLVYGGETCQSRLYHSPLLQSVPVTSSNVQTTPSSSSSSLQSALYKMNGAIVNTSNQSLNGGGTNEASLLLSGGKSNQPQIHSHLLSDCSVLDHSSNSHYLQLNHQNNKMWISQPTLRASSPSQSASQIRSMMNLNQMTTNQVSLTFWPDSATESFSSPYRALRPRPETLGWQWPDPTSPSPRPTSHNN